MSLTVEVGLLSGRTATVQAGLDEELNDLTRRAQTVFGVGKGRLLDSSRNVLDARLSIREAGVQTGDLPHIAHKSNSTSRVREKLTAALLLPFLATDLS